MFDIFYFISYSVSNSSWDVVQCMYVLRWKNAEPLCIWIWYAKCEMKFKMFPTFSRHCCSSFILPLKVEKQKKRKKSRDAFYTTFITSQIERTTLEQKRKKTAEKNKIYARNFSYYFKFTTGDERTFFHFFVLLRFFVYIFFLRVVLLRFLHSSKIAFALYDTKGPAR